MNGVNIPEAQRKYFNTGVTLSADFRLNALKRLYEAVAKNEGKLLDALKKDLGKTGFEAYMTEIGLLRSAIKYDMQHLHKWMKVQRVRTPFMQFAANSFVVPEPFGVTLIISPWNYPVLLSLEPLSGAIASGNCAVLKPSSSSPETSRTLSSIISETFPPEYICTVTGGREENASLLENKFDFIFFTGGTDTGRIVMQAAARHLTPMCLEMGGKSPVIIDGTANITLAAKRIAFGKFLNAGQTCVAPDHVYIQQDKKDELIRGLISAISEFYPGGLKDETLPHIINSKQFDRLIGLMEGKNIAVGGDYDRESLKISPTVMDELKEDSDIMQQEIFGPLLPILTYEHIEEAIAKIKSRPKPLALYLFTSDKTVKKKVLSEISFGGGCINDTMVHLATPYMGFGGVGESGMGMYHGKKSFDAFSHYKSIMDRKTWIDLPFRYAPHNQGKEKILRRLLK